MCRSTAALDVRCASARYHMRINGDQWAAQFLRNEPDYGEFDWLDTYAMAFSRYKPELRPQEVAETAAQRT